MRSAFIGLTVGLTFLCGMSLGQNAQQDDRTKAAAAEQGRTGQAAQPQRNERTGQPLQPARPGQADQTTRGQRPGQPADQSASSSDKQIAALIFGGCRNELEIAKFAQSKAQSQEVKQFAEKMLRDHQPGCEKMQQLAGELALGLHSGGLHAAPPAPGSAPAARPAPGVAPLTASPPPNQNDAVPRRSATGAVAAGDLDWNNVHQQLANQCLASTKQGLGAHSGADFDKAFMVQQVIAHQEMIDKLQVLKTHASGELQQEIEKALQMATNHHQEAKQIKEQLMDRPAERVTRNPKQ